MKTKTKLIIAGAVAGFVVFACLAMAAMFLISRSFAEHRRLTKAVNVHRAFEVAVRDGRLEEAHQLCTEQCQRKPAWLGDW